MIWIPPAQTVLENATKTLREPWIRPLTQRRSRFREQDEYLPKLWETLWKTWDLIPPVVRDSIYDKAPSSRDLPPYWKRVGQRLKPDWFQREPTVKMSLILVLGLHPTTLAPLDPENERSTCGKCKHKVRLRWYDKDVCMAMWYPQASRSPFEPYVPLNPLAILEAPPETRGFFPLHPSAILDALPETRGFSLIHPTSDWPSCVYFAPKIASGASNRAKCPIPSELALDEEDLYEVIRASNAKLR